MRLCWAGEHLCFAFGLPLDSAVWFVVASLVAAVLSGAVAVYAAYRWYRTSKEISSTRLDDLAELEKSLQDGALAPEEVERVRAAIQRHHDRK
jgi:hypothetical protein